MDGWWAVSAYWSWGGPSDSRQPLLTARPDRPTDDPPTAPATRRAIQPGGTLSTPTTRAVASALGGARVLAGLGEFVPLGLYISDMDGPRLQHRSTTDRAADEREEARTGLRDRALMGDEN